MKSFERALMTLLLLQFAFSHEARADFFAIPDLVGSAPVYNVPIVVDFDLGQEFAEVRSVLLMLQATVTPLTYQNCGTIGEPHPCELEVVNTGFLARLESPNQDSTTAVIGDFRSYPLRRAGVFERVFLEYSFDHLLDGTGTITLFWNGVSFTDDRIIQDFHPPTGEITDAVLIVDGTPRDTCRRSSPSARRMPTSSGERQNKCR